MRIWSFFVVIILIIHSVLWSGPLEAAQAPNAQVVSSSDIQVYANHRSIVLYKLGLSPGWYIYANPVGAFGRPFTITLSGEALQSYQVLWPPSEVLIKNIGEQSLKTNIYRDEVIVPIEMQFNKDAVGRGDSHISLVVEYGLCDEKTCFIQKETQSIAVPQQVAEHETNSMVQYIYMVLIALLGGLVMNFMPCVLPVIGLKLYSVLNSDSRHRNLVRLDMLSTAAGIIFTFWGFALFTIMLHALGRQVFWGMHFQSPSFVLVLIMVFSMMSTNLLGYYEISLPRRLTDGLHLMITHAKILENFAVGIMMTIMATPCLAPFLAIAIAFALTRGAYDVVVIYTAIGIGMAMPFFLLASAPRLLNYLPKPGQWMYWLKYMFAGILLMGATWLLLVLKAFIGLYGVIAVLLYLVILNGLLGSNFLLSRPKVRATLVMLLLVLLPLTPTINGYIQSEWSWYNVVARSTTTGLDYSSDSIQSPEALADKKAFEAQGLPEEWSVYSSMQLAKLISEGKVVLVDVGAEWCLTCKWNKRMVLTAEKVKNFLHADGVKVLYADYTQYSPEVAAFLEKYGRYGVPTTVVFGPSMPEGTVLPVLLSAETVMAAIYAAQ